MTDAPTPEAKAEEAAAEKPPEETAPSTSAPATREPATKATRPWRAPSADTIATWVAWAAIVFFAGTLFWEALGPMDCGHFCSTSSVAICGENIRIWRISGAVGGYFREPPPTTAYYVHHPYAVYFGAAVANALFGHGPLGARGSGILHGLFTPILVWLLARATWGRVAGAVATVAFVLAPIDLAFGRFGSLESVTIMWGLLFAWGTVRLWQTWQARWLIPATAGALGACHGDWIGFLFVGLVVAFAVLRGYVLPRRWFGRVDEREQARWYVLVTAIAVLSFVYYVGVLIKLDRVGDLTGIYQSRSSGSESPLLALAVPRRRMWLHWMLPNAMAWLMALGLPISTLRLFRGRAEEIVAPAWFLMATFQYLHFKQGADIHIFWPHYHGVSIALGAGAIAWALARALRFAWDRHRRVAMALVGATLLGSTYYFAMVGRVALLQLRQARQTGGQFDEGGNYTSTERDRAVFVSWAYQGVPDTYDLSLAWFPRNPNVEYVGRRPIRDMAPPIRPAADGPDRYVIVDTRLAPAASLQEMAKELAPVAAGPFWRIDRAAPHAPIVARRWVERQPTLFERALVVATDLVREVRAEEDPWATWEWRDLLDQGAPPVEPSEPGTVDELRVAWAMATVRGDEARAATLEQKLLASLSPPRAAYTQGLELLGVRVETGPAVVATLVWKTSADYKPTDASYDVRGEVVAPPPAYWSVTDFFERAVAPPGSARLALWRPRRIYVQRFVVPHRIGTERYKGYFSGGWAAGGAPVLVGGGALTLFTLQ